MSDLISRSAFMEKVLRMKRLNLEIPLNDKDLDNPEINNYQNGQQETFDLIIEHLEEQPIAYDKETNKAIKVLTEEYEKAKKIGWIRNPIAYALYQTWKIFDEG